MEWKRRGGKPYNTDGSLTMDRWRDRRRKSFEIVESVGRAAPFLGPGKSVAPRRIISFLVGGTVAALDTIYRATSDASSYFIDLEFLFVQVSCWQEIQVDTNRKVSLDWTRLLFTPCFHTYVSKKVV